MKNKWLLPLLLTILALSGVIALRFSLPAPSETPVTVSSPSVSISGFFNRVQSGALEGLTPVKKVYRIPEDAPVAPRPSEMGYLYTTDRAEVLALIDEARDLIGDQQVIFDEETEFVPEYGVHCYRDDSILTLVWHEKKDAKYELDITLTFTEVFLADASQLRRRLSCGDYGAGVYKFPTDMAEEVNAVLAASGDFYRFRSFGVNVYQRELYRSDGRKVDTCWFDGSGNLIFTKAGEIETDAQAEAFMKDNDIRFTICFGPVMVENGVNVVPREYFLGAPNEFLPRSCLGQAGELHYLLCMVRDFVTVSTAADYMIEKGIDRCYGLDGGQTGTIVMQGTMLNPSTYGLGNAAQRVQSDIIYFATAIPEGQ